MNKFLKDFKYLTYAMVHPFDAFYEIKWRNKGNMLLATLLLILYGITNVLKVQYSGFIVNKNRLFEINSLLIIITSIAPILLFVVSNWSVSTLYNGKAKMKDLYLLICYALFPIIITNLISIPISNVIIAEEAPLLYSFMNFGGFWFVFLMFTGLITMQEFSIYENIMTLIATLISAIIIIFLIALYFSLMEQFITFIITIVKEIVTRG